MADDWTVDSKLTDEEIDDKSMIRRLRKRIAELETQLSLARTAEVMLPTRTL